MGFSHKALAAALALGVIGWSLAVGSRAADTEPLVPSSNAALPAASPETDSSSGSNDGAAREGKAEPTKAREGTRWQAERGFFTLVGDRSTFTADRGVAVVVLENQNLERVVRTIEESRTVADSDKLEWLVDGMLTEYRGQNYLLLSRSVLVTRPKKPEATR